MIPHGPIDLHIHTTMSDGDESPDRLVEVARQRGLRVLSFTDHNTTDAAAWAWSYMRGLAGAGDACGPWVVPGIEVSAHIERDGTVDIVHILGYQVDPRDSHLREVCERIASARRQAHLLRMQEVRSEGIPITSDQEELLQLDLARGRTAIAESVYRANCKAYRDENQVYHLLWDVVDRASGKELSAPVAEAIEAIHGSSAAAICALAHPLRDEATGRNVPTARVQDRIDVACGLGIDALECYYSSFALEDCRRLEQAARERGLLVSVGSDHHSLVTERRNRLGKTAADGNNYGSQATILEAFDMGFDG